MQHVETWLTEEDTGKKTVKAAFLKDDLAV